METINMPSCNDATLIPYSPNAQNPWNTTKVKHVYRRLGFGAKQMDVDAALSLSPGDFIDNLVDTAANEPQTPAPTWGYWSLSNYTDYFPEVAQQVIDWRVQTVYDFMNENLHGRLTLFWMNHFVTELEVYGHSPYMFQYYNKIQTHSLGNVKEFVREIGISSTMLMYLNGFENTNINPNENYARELFELFTLGENNGYTQDDILETARALTGYNHRDEYGDTIYFDSSTFDNGEKTIFGQTGFWGYDDVIDILFQEKENELAFYICGKLYRYFVSPAVDQIVEQNIIQPLAATLIANNFEIIPVLKQLFKSEHFFDERALGVIIKSPYDVILDFVKETEFFYDDELVDGFVYYTALMGQELYDPPDVSGWQGDELWINASTLTGRWQLLELYLAYLYSNDSGSSFVDLARNLSNDSNDPYYITEVVIDHFMSKKLFSLGDYDIATDIFKWDVPQNYYDQGLWSLDWPTAPVQVLLLLTHIATIPEFQLK
mgnify:CR=1 FL=1|jgi:hypothetical protein|tara:strand:- start:15 stop:1484 length:1470 start_codon:yes stop_codon:yes gene_type:complete